MARQPYAIVTGGAGFIGSHAVDQLLERGYRVRAIDNLTGGRELNLAHHGDNRNLIRDWRDIRAIEPDDAGFEGVDLVLHFAGIGDVVPSIEKPLEYMDVNVQGTARVAEAARRGGARKLVYAASSSCYGLADVPTAETNPIDPQYPYALSKYLGEQTVMHWSKVYGLPVVSIRIFNAYGTRSRTSGAYGAVFGVFLRQKLAGKPFTVVGDGEQSRDFVYVTDLARAFVMAGESDRDGVVYNAGAGNPQTVNRLAELLGGEKTHIPKRPGEPDCTWADITRIRDELGWQPQVGFEEGVAKVVDNIDYWSEAPLWTPESIREQTRTWFKYLGSDQTGDGQGGDGTSSGTPQSA